MRVSAVTAPKGLPVAFTYNGSSSPPTASGNYTVIGTVSAQNYFGAATNTLQIFPLISLVAGIASNGVFTIAFTNKPGSAFSVLGTAGPLASGGCTNLGTASEVSSGLFQFSDSMPRTNAEFFYRIRSP